MPPPPPNTNVDPSIASIELAGYTSDAAKCTRAAGPNWSGGSQITNANRDTFAVEEAKVACFKVALSRSPSGQGAEVRYTLQNGTALARNDLGSISGTAVPANAWVETPMTNGRMGSISWAAGNADPRYIAVPIKGAGATWGNDDNEHCDENFSIALAPSNSGAPITLDPNRNTATTTIQPDQTKPTIRISHASQEPQPYVGGKAKFTIGLYSTPVGGSIVPVERPVAVKWRVRNGTANDRDYNTAATGTTTIPIGSYEVQELEVPIKTTATAGKTFFAEIVPTSIDSNSVPKECIANAVVAAPPSGHHSTSVTINHGPKFINIGRVSPVQENNKSTSDTGAAKELRIPVTLSASPPAGQSIVLQWRTRSRISGQQLPANMAAATPGIDYENNFEGHDTNWPTAGTITWNSTSNRTQHIAVDIIGDSKIEKDEVFYIEARVHNNSVRHASITGLESRVYRTRVTIQDNDTASISLELAGYTSNKADCTAGMSGVTVKCPITPAAPPLAACKIDNTNRTAKIPEGKHACLKASHASTGSVEVQIEYNITNISTIDADYVAKPEARREISWVRADNNAPKYVAIKIKGSSDGDSPERCDEEFQVALATAATQQGGVQADSSDIVQVRIAADSPKAMLSIAHASGSGQPYAGGSAKFKAKLSRAVGQPVQVDWGILTGINGCEDGLSGNKVACEGRSKKYLTTGRSLDFNEQASGRAIVAKGSLEQEFSPISIYDSAEVGRYFCARITGVDSTCVDNVEALLEHRICAPHTSDNSASPAPVTVGTPTPKHGAIAKSVVQAQQQVLTLSSLASVQEGGSSARLTLSLSSPAKENLSLDVAVVAADTTAAAGDYTLSSSPVRLRQGSSTAFIQITVPDDDNVESPKQLTLNIKPTDVVAWPPHIRLRGGANGQTTLPLERGFERTIQIVDNDTALVEVVDVRSVSSKAACEYALDGPDTGTSIGKHEQHLSRMWSPTGTTSPLPGTTPAQDCTNYGGTFTAASCRGTGRTAFTTEESCIRVGTWSTSPDRCAGIGLTALATEDSCKTAGTWTPAVCALANPDTETEDSPVDEGRYACVTVKLSGTVQTDITVPWSIEEVTAVQSDYGGQDFLAMSDRKFKWAAGDSGGRLYRSVAIPILRNQGSQNDECPERIKLNLSTPDGRNTAQLGTSRTATVDIAGNTDTRARVALDCPNNWALPGESVECTVRIVDHGGTGPGLDNPTLVSWRTYDNTATRGDFMSTGEAQQLTIPRGVASATFSVALTPAATVGQTFFIGLLDARRQNDEPNSTCIKVAGGGELDGAQTATGGRRQGGNVLATAASGCEDKGVPSLPLLPLLRSQQVAGGVSTNACKEIIVAGAVTYPALTVADAVREAEDDGASGSMVSLELLATRVSQPLFVNWATVAGTATAGTDYITARGMRIGHANITDQPIEINFEPDPLDENDESFGVEYTGATLPQVCETLGGTSNGTCDVSGVTPTPSPTPTTHQRCIAATGVWDHTGCTGVTRQGCTQVGGRWDATPAPASCSIQTVLPTTPSSCNDYGGVWIGGRCQGTWWPRGFRVGDDPDPVWPRDPKAMGLAGGARSHIIITDNDDCEENMGQEACEAATGTGGRTGVATAFTAARCSRATASLTNEASCVGVYRWATASCISSDGESDCTGAGKFWDIYDRECRRVGSDGVTTLTSTNCTGTDHTWVDDACIDVERGTGDRACQAIGGGMTWHSASRQCRAPISERECRVSAPTWREQSCTCPNTD